MATASARNRSMGDINITPLVDVMLVLLVIFMVTVPAVRVLIDFLAERIPPEIESNRLQCREINRGLDKPASAATRG